MRRSLVFFLTVCAAAIALQPTASATTAPTLTVRIHVVMTDKSVILGTHKSYRGWYANFIVVNHGTKKHKFSIGGLATPVLAPGGRYVLKVELSLRGSVKYQEDVSAGPHTTGTFTVV